MNRETADIANKPCWSNTIENKMDVKIELLANIPEEE